MNLWSYVLENKEKEKLVYHPAGLCQSCDTKNKNKWKQKQKQISEQASLIREAILVGIMQK